MISLRHSAKRSAKALLRRLGYNLTRLDSPTLPSRRRTPIEISPYEERPEYGPSNIETKLKNLENGLPFEFPDIVNLNNAVAMLAEGVSSVAELGCGTGKFAATMAKDPKCQVVASEFHEPTFNWCIENLHSAPNITFVNGPVSDDLAPFELSVAIEVVEHIANYTALLHALRSLAPRSLITTPNRKRSKHHYHSGPPEYVKHVREWTAGEFFWVLRSFWRDVRLYALESDSSPISIPVDVDTTLSPLIAACSDPLPFVNNGRRHRS